MLGRLRGGRRLGAAAFVSALVATGGASPILAAHPVHTEASGCAAVGGCVVTHGLPSSSVTLNAVDCPTTADCVAVGGTSDAPTYWTERDGHWTSITASMPAVAGAVALVSVACPSTGHCWSAGVTQGGALGGSITVVQSGRSLRDVRLPVLSGGRKVGLTSISCATDTSCVAVGASYRGHDVDQRGFVMSLVHGVWRADDVPGLATSQHVEFTSVSCERARPCVAVGYSYSGSAHDNLVVATRTDGVWSARHVSRPSGVRDAVFQSVSCPASQECVAVGSIDVGSLPLVEDLDGTRWSDAPVRSSSTWNESLQAVSCAAASSCLGVGSYETGCESTNNAYPLDATLAGGTWTASSVRHLNLHPCGYQQLFGVSCPGPDDCVAVGWGEGPSIFPIVDTWNGTTWVSSESLIE